MKISLFVLLGLMLIGCSEKKDNDESNDKEKSEKLILRNASFKNDETLIKTKYEYAILKCSLWTKMGDELDKTKDIPKIVEWDFKNNFDVKKELSIKTDIGKYQVEYKISVFDLYISDVHYNLDGKTYKRDMSPVIEFEYDYNSIKYYSWGSSSADGHGTSKFAYENLSTQVVGSSSVTGDAPDVTFSNFMDCEISAKIKDQFADQFPESKE
jgi:hypothetical protein